MDGVSPWLWLVAPLGLALILILLAQTVPDLYGRWLDNENRSALELMHVIIPAIAFVFAVRILRLSMLRDDPWIFAWVGIVAVGCLYIAGEEASWGQHYLGWETPDNWANINDQNETNLHNTSSWFDQKPRLIFEIGVIVGGILIPIYAYFRPETRRRRFAIILPPVICLPAALLAEFAAGSERVIELLGGTTYIFYRSSEVQETYFYWFVLMYLIVLGQRVRAHRWS